MKCKFQINKRWWMVFVVTSKCKKYISKGNFYRKTNEPLQRNYTVRSRQLVECLGNGVLVHFMLRASRLKLSKNLKLRI